MGNLSGRESASDAGIEEQRVLAVSGQMLIVIAGAIAELDADTDPLDALLIAYCSMHTDIAAGTSPLTEDDLRLVGVAVIASPELAARVKAQRLAVLPPIFAERLGLKATDRKLTHDMNVWSSVVAAAYAAGSDARGRPRADVVDAPAALIPSRIQRAFEQITGRTTPDAAKPAPRH